MNMHTVMVTYNRLELTKQAVESYLDTVVGPYSLLIVDNNSTDGTREWLHDESPEEAKTLLLPRNMGFWVALGWFAAYLIFPTETLWVAVPFALNAAVVAVNHWLSSD